MRDIYIDPVTGDLGISGGKMRLTEPGGEASSQRLRVRLRQWRGDYILDLRVGMPYVDYLGQKAVERRFREMLRRSVVTCPGIASLDSFALTVESDRTAFVDLEAQALDGTPVDLSGFIVGEL